MKSTRKAYGEALVELGKENENVVVVDADLSKTTFTNLFQKEFQFLLIVADHYSHQKPHFH